MTIFYIGVDGGASKCTARIEDEEGALLGEASAGPANIRLSINKSWNAILKAMQIVLDSNYISLQDKQHQFYIGMGLAGCENEQDYDNFLNYPHALTNLFVTTDAHIACLGAHQGNDGAIIISGTGTIGFQQQQNRFMRVGGWGFPHDDEGGGAWLGLQAIKKALYYYDGRHPEHSILVEAVFNHFKVEKVPLSALSLVNWANHANATAFATLAPLVIRAAEKGETAAILLLQEAAFFLDKIAEALFARQIDQTFPLPCVLIGGIAPFLKSYVNNHLRERLILPLQSPQQGAIIFAREKRKAQIEKKFHEA